MNGEFWMWSEFENLKIGSVDDAKNDKIYYSYFFIGSFIFLLLKIVWPEKWTFFESDENYVPDEKFNLKKKR